jgi:hypothetical protein
MATETRGYQSLALWVSLVVAWYWKALQEFLFIDKEKWGFFVILILGWTWSLTL